MECAWRGHVTEHVGYPLPSGLMFRGRKWTNHPDYLCTELRDVPMYCPKCGQAKDIEDHAEYLVYGSWGWREFIRKKNEIPTDINLAAKPRFSAPKIKPRTSYKWSDNDKSSSRERSVSGRGKSMYWWKGLSSKEDSKRKMSFKERLEAKQDYTLKFNMADVMAKAEAAEVAANEAYEKAEAKAKARSRNKLAAQNTSKQLQSSTAASASKTTPKGKGRAVTTTGAKTAKTTKTVKDSKVRFQK